VIGRLLRVGAVIGGLWALLRARKRRGELTAPAERRKR
jgi:hypothetical protein